MCTMYVLVHIVGEYNYFPKLAKRWYVEMFTHTITRMHVALLRILLFRSY